MVISTKEIKNAIKSYFVNKNGSHLNNNRLENLRFHLVQFYCISIQVSCACAVYIDHQYAMLISITLLFARKLNMKLEFLLAFDD